MVASIPRLARLMLIEAEPTDDQLHITEFARAGFKSKIVWDVEISACSVSALGLCAGPSAPLPFAED